MNVHRALSSPLFAAATDPLIHHHLMHFPPSPSMTFLHRRERGGIEELCALEQGVSSASCILYLNFSEVGKVNTMDPTC